MWGGEARQVKLYSRLTRVQKRQKCKFVLRLLSMIVEAKSHTQERLNMTNWRYMYCVYSLHIKCLKSVFKLGKTQYMYRLLVLEAFEEFWRGSFTCFCFIVFFLERNVKWTLLLETSSNTWHQKERLRDTTPRYCNLFNWMPGGMLTHQRELSFFVCYVRMFACVLYVLDFITVLIFSQWLLCFSTPLRLFRQPVVFFFHYHARSHCSWEIWKRNLLFLLYFYLLPSTLIRHESGAFQKRSSND